MDFADEDLRRLVVNAAYHLVGTQVPEKADVAYVDAFEPTFYGNNSGDHYKKLNRKPADYALGKSSMTAWPKHSLRKKRKSQPPQRKSLPMRLRQSLPQPPLPVRKRWPHRPRGSASCSSAMAWLSAMFITAASRQSCTCATPARSCFSATWAMWEIPPGFRPHPSRVSQWASCAGAPHPDKQVHHGKGFFSTAGPVADPFAGRYHRGLFGYNESFDGPSKVGNFEAELDAWVKHTLSNALARQGPLLVCAGLPHRF